MSETSNKGKETKAKLSTAGKIVLGISGVSVAAIFAVSTPFLSPALRRICLPYVPATETQITNIMTALNNRKGNLIDLGSGDGRVVIAAATKEFKSIGVELNPWLVLYSRIKSFHSGMSKMTKFKRENIFKHDLSKYDNVVVFGVDSLMEPLRIKLVKEMKDDSVIVACRFPFKSIDQPLTYGHGIDTVWKYRKIDLLKN